MAGIILLFSVTEDISSSLFMIRIYVKIWKFWILWRMLADEGLFPSLPSTLQDIVSSGYGYKCKDILPLRWWYDWDHQCWVQSQADEYSIHA